MSVFKWEKITFGVLSATAIDFNYWSYGLWHWLNNGCDIFIFFFFIIKIVCLNDFFFKGLSYHTRSIFIRSEISWNSYVSGVLVTLGEKIVTCVIFLVRTWFTIPFHAKIVHFFKQLVTWLPVLFSLSTRNL